MTLATTYQKSGVSSSKSNCAGVQNVFSYKWTCVGQGHRSRSVNSQTYQKCVMWSINMSWNISCQSLQYFLRNRAHQSFCLRRKRRKRRIRISVKFKGRQRYGVPWSPTSAATVTSDVTVEPTGWSLTQVTVPVTVRPRPFLLKSIHPVVLRHWANGHSLKKCPQKMVFDLLTLRDLEISANVIVAT